MKIEALEGARGFAALYVMLHHLNPFSSTRLEILTRFGQEAVILFFLVSGFVIYYSHSNTYNAKSAREFILRRALRIYPIFVISLFLGVLASMTTGDITCVTARGVFGNLLMLQDISTLKSGTWVAPLCSNSPLWSLSYEWWFYIAFMALYFFGKDFSHNTRRLIVTSLSVLGGILFLIKPEQPFLFASYFAIWWTGLELAREILETGSASLKGQKFSITLMLAGILIWTIPTIQTILEHRPHSFGVEPILQLRHFIAGIFFLIIVIAAHHIPRIPHSIYKPFTHIAPISYGLYVSHQPIITIIRSIGLPHTAELATSIIFSLLCAYILELTIQPIAKKIFTLGNTLHHPREAK
ncbi:MULTISPECIES: acyltransferase family protein [Cupriavidus]